MKTKSYIVTSGRRSARAIPRQSDQSPLDAATRAVRRIFGRSASVWRWNLDGTTQSKSGEIVAEYYAATVVGPQSKKAGGFPVLGEARCVIYLEGSA